MSDTASKAETSSPLPGRPEAADDQQTIVTGSPPIPCPAASDSADRILEGRVMPGDRMGNFELVEYVGGGGMGRVFRARDVKLGRTVALKILPPEQAVERDALQRFQNEAQSAARLDHENIARVYYVGEDRGLPYIVTEFVEGVNLRALVERAGPLPLAEAISYTLQIAEALAHADSRGVVHRDIKPSNVLIASEGRVKLIDLGLARVRQSAPAADDLTASGVTLGTFDYISPEQARDPRHADVRSDIYSLGCTLFFALAGQPPFPEGTVLQKLLQHQGDRPPDIRSFRPELPEELNRVLEKMMAKDPDRRYAGPGELVGDLLALAERVGLQPMSPTSRIWLRPPPPPPLSLLGRHLPWMMPVAALFCAVLLLNWYWSRQDDNARQPVETAKVDRAKGASVPNSLPLPKTASEKGRPVDLSPAELLDDPGFYFAPEEGNYYTPGSLADLKSPAAADAESAAPPPPGLTPKESPSQAVHAEERGDFRPGSNAPNKPSPTAAPRDEPSGGAPEQAEVLIVGDSAEEGNEYASLAAALASASDGDVIELRFNGPREERPIKLSNLQVTVRPGKGCRPLIVFRPDKINPVVYPRNMLTLSAGRLTLIDVAMELHVPRDLPADNWSLIETWGGQSLRLERCALTIRNASDQLTAYHPDAAFISARPAPDAGTSMEGAPAATPLASIELVDSIARGEAAFLRVVDLQPVHLLWDNGLLVVSESLLTAGGGQAAPKPDETLRIELRRLTAIVFGGLCRLTSTPSKPYQLTVQFVCLDDVFAAAPGAPLVEQDGVVSVEQSRQRFVWNGNRNYYQDVDVFWMTRNIDPDVPPESMSFETWKTYWGPSRENQPSRSPLPWKMYPGSDRPLHAHAPADYTLDYPAFDQRWEAAPGCRSGRLPALLAEPPIKRPSPNGYFRGSGSSHRSGRK
ncbi:MAG: serine/threonine protein kinase [Pirellulales bacterium]|nr:serine/threonine protein kinase [Pirellulales bacterium]